MSETTRFQKDGRLAWLDALRGFAALCVVFDHGSTLLLLPARSFLYQWLNLGQYGVFVFFLVSGYIVPASLERKGSIRGFWIGRVFRLYPMLITALVLSLIAYEFGYVSVADAGKHPLAALLGWLLMLQNLVAGLNVPVVIWTLSYEMVFYLLLTALFAWNAHRRSGWYATAFAVGAVALGGVIPMSAIGRWTSTPGGAPLRLNAAADALVLGGIALSLLSRSSLARAGASLAALVALVLVTFNQGYPYPWSGCTILALMFTGTLIYRVWGGDPPAPPGMAGASPPHTPPRGVTLKPRDPRAVAGVTASWPGSEGDAEPASPGGVAGVTALWRGSGGGAESVSPGGVAGGTVPRAAVKILHIVTDALPSTSAGYTIRTQEVALAQQAVGLDPHVSTRIGFPVTAGAIDGRATVKVDGVPYHRLLPWVMPGRMDRLCQTHLRHAARLTQRLGPSVLHAASNYANAVIALALRDATGLPVVYEVRGFWEDTWLSRHATSADLKLSDRYIRTRALETSCMSEADLVVTLGEAMRAEIIERGVPAGNVIIVPNGVSEEFLRPLPDDGGRLRASLGIKPDENVVGLVSSLVAHEGLGTLLEAVKILGDRGVPTRALIVGDGPERTSLQRQAAELGLNAIFTGRVPSARVRDYHALLGAFVVPRTPDRVCQLVTPLKPVEAMASGLPVVVSGVRALEEIVRDGETGLVFPPQDAGALADQLQSLVANPGLRTKIGSAARDWAARDRTWAHNAVRYRQAYNDLLQSAAPRGRQQQDDLLDDALREP